MVMKRHLLKLVLFVLLGAVVNVAVAWGCALFIDRQKTSGYVDIVYTYEYIFGGESEFEIETRPGIQVVLVELRRLNDPTIRNNPRWSKLATPRWMRSNVPSAWYVEGWIDKDERVMIGSGWPARTLYCDYVCIGRGYAQYLRSGIPLPGSRFPTYSLGSAASALPLHPIWSGFILNTILYAAILWVPFALFALRRGLRRVLRRRRGACLICGYDLRGTSGGGGGGGCPECGWRREEKVEA